MSDTYEQIGVLFNGREFIPIDIVKKHAPIAVGPDETCEAVYRKKESAA